MEIFQLLRKSIADLTNTVFRINRKIIHRSLRREEINGNSICSSSASNHRNSKWQTRDMAISCIRSDAFRRSFFSLILLRVGADHWPHGVEEGLSIPLATLNTMVLITSSVTMVMSWASLKMNQFGKFQLYLAATILLAFVFLVVKYFEYTAKFHHGHYPCTNTFYATYFTMTGLHGLHVVGGIIVNGYLLLTGRRAWKKDPDRLQTELNMPDCTGILSIWSGFSCSRFYIFYRREA